MKTGDPANDSGNFAMLDMIQALKFVQANIAAFGGDAGKVTLMGQSAGGVNVLALMTSPLVVQATPKLFHRIVPLSGGISTVATIRPVGSLPAIGDLRDYAKQGDELLLQSLIADGTVADHAAAQAWAAAHTSAEAAAYLRGKAPDALLRLVRQVFPLIPAVSNPLGNIAGSNPLPDGNVLPVDPIAAIRAGNYLKVPVLAGITRDEVKLFPSLLPLLGAAFPSGRLINDATVFNIAFNYNPEGAATTTVQDWIPPVYLPVADPFRFNHWTDFLNQYWFKALRDDLLGSLQTQQTGIWHYQFDWDEEPAPFNDIFGAAHAFDLPFMFGNFGPSLYANISFTTANRPGRLALSDAMMKSLGAFARNGDPNDASLGVTWPQWPNKLIFDASPAATTITVQ
jgi:carboxylesterase type B